MLSDRSSYRSTEEGIQDYTLRILSHQTSQKAREETLCLKLSNLKHDLMPGTNVNLYLPVTAQHLKILLHHSLS